ncbi:MAG: ATP-binding domain-containing protein [Myxococcota bacterium]
MTDSNPSLRQGDDGRAARPAPSYESGAVAPKTSTEDAPDLSIALDEEERCEAVVEYLRHARPSQPPVQHNDDKALLTLRDQIATSRLEDVPALMAQMQQVAAVASNRNRQKASEPVDPNNPYFGHLRLKEEGRGTRDVYIGRSTYIEPKQNIRIVDWRHAPVSQLYYRYDEGAQYEETFGDREVNGELLVRRTLTIRDGDLRRVQAPQGLFVKSSSTNEWRRLDNRAVSLEGGEGAAVRAEHIKGTLGAAARGDDIDQREDRHLPEIAALLDPRQFELISRPDSGLVVIQGGAGSGKTTIGVHRLAFLAFQSEVRFSAERMLVVVGTPALRDYIGQLLEALDIGKVQVVTYVGWSRRQRRRSFDWLSKLPIEENTPVEVSRLKTDPTLLKLLVENGKKMRKQGKTSVRDAVALWADTLTNKKALFRAFGPGLKDGTARLTEAQLDRAVAWCADRCPAVEEFNQDRDEEAAAEDEVEGADGVVEVSDDRATLDDEDESLLLRCYQLVRGPLRYKNKALVYEHLFVDEAQDLAPVDLAVLADIVSSQKSITLAGDTSQRLHLDTGFNSWDEVLGALGLEHVQIEPLRIAYRSTQQVMKVARSVLGHLAEPEAPVAPRSGAPVEHHNLPTQGAAAAFLGDALRPLLLREPRATVAVLARYPEQADAYYNALRMAEVPHLRRIRDFDFAFKPGVEVTEIKQVKGLEYDYVILVDVTASSYPDNDEARYQLHVGCTRAAHQLWVVSTGQPSPLLPGWLID